MSLIAHRVLGSALLTLCCAMAAQPAQAQSTSTCTAADLRGMQRNWLFGGNMFIDFGVSGSNYSISSITPPANMEGGEGNTVASLGNGTLQLWVASSNSSGTDHGLRGDVMNRNNAIMPNGTGIFGGNSAAQSFVSFPAPAAPGRYFIVGNSAMQGVSNAAANALYASFGGFGYSVVEMSAAGGLGDVTTKNVVLIDPATTPLANKMHEAMTVVPNADGSGHWVITAEAGTTNVRTFLFDSSGPVGTPILSNVQDRNPPIIHGTVRASPADPSLLVYTSNDSDPNDTRFSEIYLLRLDRSTGVVTQEVKWNVPLQRTIGFSADFSPSGQHVYFTSIRRLQPDGLVLRYDITSGDAATIEASQLQITSSGETGLIQRGPDGAMWVKKAMGGVLRITNPDAAMPATEALNPTNELAGNYGLPQITGSCASWQATPPPVVAHVPVGHPLALLAAMGLIGFFTRRHWLKKKHGISHQD